MLDCRQAERMVMPFIDMELSDPDMEAFLRHIKSCPNCREELEIYYTVFLGLRQLDQENGAYDIAGQLEENLQDAWLRIRMVRLRSVVCYAVNTLAATGLLTSLILQLRIWIQRGM